MEGEIERDFAPKIANGEWALKMCKVTAFKGDAEKHCQMSEEDILRKISDDSFLTMEIHVRNFSKILQAVNNLSQDLTSNKL